MPTKHSYSFPHPSSIKIAKGLHIILCQKYLEVSHEGVDYMTTLNLAIPPYSTPQTQGEPHPSEHHIAVHISSPPPPSNIQRQTSQVWASQVQPPGYQSYPTEPKRKLSYEQERAEGQVVSPTAQVVSGIEGVPTNPPPVRSNWLQRGIKLGMAAGCVIVGVATQQILLQLNPDHEEVANNLLKACCVSVISPGISLIIDDVLGQAAKRRIYAGIASLFSASLIDSYQGHHPAGEGIALTTAIGGALVVSYPIFSRCVRGEHVCPYLNTQSS